MTEPTQPRAIDIEQVMAEVRARVRDDVRARLVRNGAVEFTEEQLFVATERLLHDALPYANRERLLLPELLDDEDAWRLDPALRLSSHRPMMGGALVWLKRRLLLPIMRWLFDYSRENFARQERLNFVLMACLERLAVDHARLTARVEALERGQGISPS